VLGFPKPGHSYWTRGTLDAVRARLEPWGMDMAPYEAAWAEAEAPSSEGGDGSGGGGGGAEGMDQLRQENASLREELATLRARASRG